MVKSGRVPITPPVSSALMDRRPHGAVVATPKRPALSTIMVVDPVEEPITKTGFVPICPTVSSGLIEKNAQGEVVPRPSLPLFVTMRVVDPVEEPITN